MQKPGKYLVAQCQPLWPLRALEAFNIMLAARPSCDFPSGFSCISMDTFWATD